MDINFDIILEFGLWLALSLIVIDWWWKRAWPALDLLFRKGLLGLIRQHVPGIGNDDLLFVSFHLIGYYGVTSARRAEFLRVSRVSNDGDVSIHFQNIGEKCPTLEVFIEMTNPTTNNTFMVAIGYGAEHYDLADKETQDVD